MLAGSENGSTSMVHDELVFFFVLDIREQQFFITFTLSFFIDVFKLIKLTNYRPGGLRENLFASIKHRLGFLRVR